MDEKPVYFDMPHNRTMHPVGDKKIDMAFSGHEKTRFTVTITVSAKSRVLSAYMILRGLKKTPKVKSPSNVILSVEKVLVWSGI